MDEIHSTVLILNQCTGYSLKWSNCSCIFPFIYSILGQSHRTDLDFSGLCKFEDDSLSMTNKFRSSNAKNLICKFYDSCHANRIS